MFHGSFHKPKLPGMMGGHGSDPVGLKFQFEIQVKQMQRLPSKYKRLRVSLTRGSKAASTKEIFALNQAAEVGARDGTMRMVATMYRSAQGGFEEKTYKLSLLRINPTAIREKEKKIGSCYLNLAEYARMEHSAVAEDLRMTMKVSESTEPTVFQIAIRCVWLKDYKPGADSASDISGMSLDTASQATSHASSANSAADAEELSREDSLLEDETPAATPERTPVSTWKEPAARTPLQPLSDSKPPLPGATLLEAKAAVASLAENKELRRRMEEAVARAERSEEMVKDLEAALDAKQTELDRASEAQAARGVEEDAGVRKELMKTAEKCRRLQAEADKATKAQREQEEKCKKLQAETDAALRAQEELKAENARLAAEEAALLKQVYEYCLEKKNSPEKKAAATPEKHVPDPMVGMLQAEVDKLKKDVAGLRKERDELKRGAQWAEEKLKEAEEERRKEVAALKAERDRMRGELEGLEGKVKSSQSTQKALQESLDAEKGKAGKGKRSVTIAEDAGGGDGRSMGELQAELAKAKAKASQYKDWLAQVTEAKGALESELATLRAGGVPVAKSPAGAGGGGGEVAKLQEEMEAIKMQLVTASLGYAQAEQDKLEAKQAVYQLKITNRRLRERLTKVEVNLYGLDSL